MPTPTRALPPIPSPTGAPPRVLVVDDTEANRYLARRYLERAGFVVDEADTAGSAVAAARGGFDLVVLDVNLPDGSGYDVVRALRADPSGASAAVIHTSAHHVDADRRAEGLEAGADAYLTQPIDPRELVAVAHTLLRVRRAEQQARAAYEAEHAARVEAQAANRAKSEFLAVMSHELRTPLNAIGGYAELMALGIRGPVTAEQQEDLARIQKAQQHLLGLINAVLNYARVEAGAVQYALADVRACEALAVVEALVTPQLRAKSLTFRTACAADLVVRADPEKLQQVLLNLLSNAVKFTRPGGQITVTGEAAADGGAVRLVVGDTGIGIPGAKLAAIFEPFVQVDQRLTRVSEGVGLGLAISRDLARGMGGDLTASSVVGAGSAFTLRLPAAPAALA